MHDEHAIPSPTIVAEALAIAFDQRGLAYAFGGAIALGYWAEPRGTIDVDVTLFISDDKPSECIRILGEVGCDVPATEALALLQEHGFCRATYHGLRVDVFMPSIPFYELAKARRRRVPLRGTQVWVWDPETLAVFKLMFFREKDLIDLKQILRNQSGLDRAWIRNQLVDIYGGRDLRIMRWDELCNEIQS